MKRDRELRRDVEKELAWEPSIDDERIGVSVIDGIVTLAGEVSTCSEKWMAERAAERVAGVRAVVDELTVRLAGDYTKVDIAKAAVEAIARNVHVPSDRVKVRVDDGWVTLTGTVQWRFQSRAAERAVRNLPGVKGIKNLITVEPSDEPEDIKHKIEESFKRAAALDARNIDVQVSGGEVTLRGRVHSWLERDAAEKAAWAAPGLTSVHNYITVDLPASIELSGPAPC
jgi:osmotically-inducible protein OsmY